MKKFSVLIQAIATLLIASKCCQSNSDKIIKTTPVGETASTTETISSILNGKSKQQTTLTTKTQQLILKQQREDEQNSKGNKSHDSLSKNNKLSESSSKKTNDCEYEKGSWQECKNDGIQERTYLLKTTNSNGTASSSKCEPIKIVRRECKMVGCKYVRGQWSPTCTDGLRVRIDSLVVNGMNNNNTTTTTGNNSRKLDGGNFECKPKRKVVKDCKRACHYVKQPWSECKNGFKTRNLTLQNLPPTLVHLEPQKHLNGIREQTHLDSNQMFGLGCVKEKVIKRECKARDFINGNGSILKLNQSQNRESQINSNKIHSTKLTAAQKRKLRLQKQQQQQR